MMPWDATSSKQLLMTNLPDSRSVGPKASQTGCFTLLKRQNGLAPVEIVSSDATPRPPRDSLRTRLP